MPTTTAPDVEQLVAELYRQRRRAWEAALVTAQNFLETIADELLDNVDRDRLNAQTARIKEPSRAADKIRRKMSEGKITPPLSIDDIADALGDVIGIKVLCKTPRDLNAFTEQLGLACRSPECSVQFAEAPVDYVGSPKDSGYRAYHAVLLITVATHQGDLGVKVEVQVKTRLQDAWGELTHEDMYKPGEALKPNKVHLDYATRMADLLAEVDMMADSLALQLDSQTEEPVAAEPRVEAEGAEIRVRITRTGPRYALAVAPDGRRGLIPARSVRAVIGSKERINVDDYLAVDDFVRVVVEDTESALYYNLAALPSSRKTAAS